MSASRTVNRFPDRRDQVEGGRSSLLPALAFLLLAAALMAPVCVLNGQRMANRAEEQLRERMSSLKQEISLQLNPNLARGLDFGPWDREKPEFLALHDQLSVASLRTGGRSLYVLGLVRGELVFGPSVPGTGPDRAEDRPVPGELFARAPHEARAAFHASGTVFSQPYRHGEREIISLFTPVFIPDRDLPVMVVALDFPAREWRDRIQRERFSQVPLTIVAFLLLVLGSAATRRYNRRRLSASLDLRPWVVTPVFLILLASLVIFGLNNYRQIGQVFIEESERVGDRAREELNRLILDRMILLREIGESVIRDPALREALAEGDQAALAEQCRPFMAGIAGRYRLSTLSFINSDGLVIFRAHRPGIHGDRPGRRTIEKARLTGLESWGFEGSDQSGFALRLVKPVDWDGVPGFIELGIESTHLVRQLGEVLDCDIVSVFRKGAIPRETFENSRTASGWAGLWDEFPGVVVGVQTVSSLPSEIVSILRNIDPGDTPERERLARINHEGRVFTASLVGVSDTGGKDVLDLYLLDDITVAIAAAQANSAYHLALGLILLAGLTALLWSVTGRAENQLTGVLAGLAAKEANLAVTLDSIGDGVIATNTLGRVTRMNPVAEQLTGWPLDEAIGRPFSEIFSIADSAGGKPARNPIARAMADGHAVTLEKNTVLRSRDGRRIHVADSAAPIRDENGSLTGAVMVFRDITEEHRLERQLVEKEERFAQIALASKDIIWEADPGGVYTYVSEAVRETLGWEPLELIGRKTIFDILHEEDRKVFLDQFMPPLRACKTIRAIEIRSVTRDGREIWLRRDAFPYNDENGRLAGYRGSDTDITARREAEQILRRMATTDELTGLRNRRYLVDAGNREWARSLRYGIDFSIIMLDLDHFKQVNDRYGHAAGDETLRRAASLVGNSLREADVAARIGGEEFCLLLPHTNLERARALAGRLRLRFEKMTVDFEGREIRVTASFGVASNRGRAGSFEELLKNADEALYRAKKDGRNLVRTFAGDKKKGAEKGPQAG